MAERPSEPPTGRTCEKWDSELRHLIRLLELGKLIGPLPRYLETRHLLDQPSPHSSRGSPEPFLPSSSMSRGTSAGPRAAFLASEDPSSRNDIDDIVRMRSGQTEFVSRVHHTLNKLCISLLYPLEGVGMVKHIASDRQDQADAKCSCMVYLERVQAKAGSMF